MMMFRWMCAVAMREVGSAQNCKEEELWCGGDWWCDENVLTV